MTSDEERRLRLYEELLLKWSAKVNLVGPDARSRLWEHIEEALEAARILDPSGEVLDVGSGGGLPAIPMAIVAPSARFHLVEADQKKWAFLKFAVRECALNSVVHGDRLDRVAQQLDPHLEFSLVTSRAVGHVEEWLPAIVPTIAKGGRVALFEGVVEPPHIEGLELKERHRLPRGDANYLTVLERFHVEHHG